MNKILQRRWALTISLTLLTACGSAGKGADDAVAADSVGDATAEVRTQDIDAPDELADQQDVTSLKDVTSLCPGAADCSCKENGDCDSALCIDTPSGQRCARKCVEDCPTGFRCALVLAPSGDNLTICVPRWGALCDPCAASKACATLGNPDNVCVDQGAAGAFCGSACGSDDDCPAAYGCATVQTVEGAQAKQCVRKPGAEAECSCSTRAVMKALETTCYVSVKDGDTVIGKCAGTRGCTDKGLLPCSAPPAGAELCDGVDNDCDGDTDEATCNDKNPCTQDVCDPSAKGAELCSHTNTAAPCNADDSVCTTGDACKDGKCVAGKAKSCDDKNPCTLDSCSPATGCKQTPDSGAPCDDDNPCTLGDTCNPESACSAGPSKPCESSAFCTIGACDITTGKCKFKHKQKGLPCNDGNVCTNSDGCNAGACEGKIKACGDGNPCTDDGCDPTAGCINKANNSPCDDGDKCTMPDKCKDGGCAAGGSKSCDDKNPCTKDSCDAKTATCKNVVSPGFCTDDDACTVGDKCAKGGCKAGISKACNDGNPCTKDACDSLTGKCLNVAVAGPCSDGDLCTVSDICVLGKCKGGAIKLCGDGDNCTEDACTPKSGKCVNTKINGCGGNCQSAKDCEDNNPCTVNQCAAGKCAFPPAPGPCDDGDPCTQGDGCIAGGCKPGKPKDCDDGNPCTLDGCDGKTGMCAHAGKAAPCSDGDACTSGDACDVKLGICKPGKVKACDDGNTCTKDSCDTLNGNCVAVPRVGSCVDGDKCTRADTCLGGKCVGKVNLCDDGNSCTKGVCKSGSGACVQLPQGGKCSDNNPCTVGDSCDGKNATCNAGPQKVCDDKNPCTADSCKPSSGECAFQPTTEACEDGSPCTMKDTCKAGVCAAGLAKVCDDKDPCTADGCDESSGTCVAKKIIGCGGNCAKAADCDDKNKCTADQCNGGKCAFPFNAALCSDGDPCTVGESCVKGACKPKGSKNCDDGNPCTVDLCDSKAGGKCSSKPTTRGCTDNNPCTIDDVCMTGSCKSGKAKVCLDNNGCTSDACDPSSGACVFKPTTAPCDDGNGCTVKDVCAGGACKAGPQKSCGDGHVCTTDSCQGKTGVCLHAPNTQSCTDNNSCTLSDVCSGGGCVPGKSKSCSDNNSCTTDSCNPNTGSCSNTSNTAPCDDNNACTKGDKCAAGECLAGTGKVCDDKDMCTTDSCNTKTGSCVSVPIIGCGGNCAKPSDCDDSNPCTDNACASGKCAFPANILSCSDGNACTSGDKCAAGACKAGKSKVCDDGNGCTNDSCAAKTGACVNSANTNKCEDGNACTSGDKCAAGACKAGKSKVCNDGNGCTNDSCQPGNGNCVAQPNSLPCSDGSACTANDKCAKGACQPGAKKSCDDGNPCTNDACNPQSGGCSHQNNSAPCSDGSACTLGDVCAGGTCKSGISKNCDDANGCTSDTCAAQTGVCANTANTAVCSDGKPCTLNDVCKGKSCQPGSLKGCDDKDGCTKDACNTGTGKCSSTPIIGCGGNCKTAGDCGDSNVCTDDICKNGKCAFPSKSGSACSDNNHCTIGDTCKNGSCVPGKPKGCDDGNPCTNDSCDLATGNCKHVNNTATCSDGDACTVGDACSKGVCAKGTPKNCDDGNPCTKNSCNVNNGACKTAPKTGVSCDDADACTVGEHCQSSGACGGGTPDCWALPGMQVTGIAVDSAGAAIIVGYGLTASTKKSAYVKCFTADTHTLKATFKVGSRYSSATTYNISPHVKRSAVSGISVVYWHDMGAWPVGPYDWRNYAVFLDAKCNVISGPIQVDGATPAGIKRAAHVEIDDQGRTVMVYPNQSISKHRIMIWDKAGKVVKRQTTGGAPCGYGGMTMSLAMNRSNGDFMLVCETSSSGTRYARRFQITGAATDAKPIVIPELTNKAWDNYASAMDRKGNMAFIGKGWKLVFYNSNMKLVKLVNVPQKSPYPQGLQSTTKGFLFEFYSGYGTGWRHFTTGGVLIKTGKQSSHIALDGQDRPYRWSGGKIAVVGRDFSIQ